MSAAPEEKTGFVFGATNAFGLAAGTAAVVLISLLVDSTNVKNGFYALSALVVVIASLTILSLRKHDREVAAAEAAEAAEQSVSVAPAASATEVTEPAAAGTEPASPSRPRSEGEADMKLLAIEASQNATYYISRYQQIEERGAEVFVLNGIGTEDFWAADRYRIAGSKHIEDIVTAAKQWHAEEEFEGVLTFSESGVVTVAVVAEALGLPSIGFEAARTSRNKLLMRQAHERGGAAHPGFRHAPDVEAALAAGEELGYPLILKPTLGAASNFVFKVDDPQEMRARFADATSGIETMTWA